jgi:hypothetical protein
MRQPGGAYRVIKRAHATLAKNTNTAMEKSTN